MDAFDHLAVGGTFDLLHAGHKALLKYAFSKAKKVSIGITTDKFVKVNEKETVKSLSERRLEVENFLASEKLITRSQIVLLNDVYGTAIDDKTIEGIVITEETEKGGVLINTARSKAGLTPLPLLHFSMVKADDGEPISSTRIRRGEIDRKGFSYFGFLTAASRFILPDYLREELSMVQGKLVGKSLNYTEQDAELSGIGNHQKNVILGSSAVQNDTRREVLQAKSDSGQARMTSGVGKDVQVLVPSRMALRITVGDETTRNFVKNG